MKKKKFEMSRKVENPLSRDNYSLSKNWKIANVP